MIENTSPSEASARTWRESLRLYLQPASLRMLLLGFSAGLPLLLVLGTLSFRLREAGIDRATIGYLSWVGLAYGFKWAWAPLVDRLPIPGLTGWLGRRRSWLLVSQVAIAAGLAGMALNRFSVRVVASAGTTNASMGTISFADAVRTVRQRGLPRLRSLFNRWIARVSREIASGCIYISGAVEFDDRPGPVRDALADMVRAWHQALEKAIQLAIEVGHLRNLGKGFLDRIPRQRRLIVEQPLLHLTVAVAGTRQAHRHRRLPKGVERLGSDPGPCDCDQADGEPEKSLGGRRGVAGRESAALEQRAPGPQQEPVEEIAAGDAGLDLPGRFLHAGVPGPIAGAAGGRRLPRPPRRRRAPQHKAGRARRRRR